MKNVFNMFGDISNAAAGLVCGAVGLGADLVCGAVSVGADLASGAVGMGCAAASAVGDTVCTVGVAVGDAVSAAASFGWDVLKSPPAILGYKFLGYATLAGVGVYAVYVVATVVLAALPYLMLCAVAYALLANHSSSGGGRGSIDSGLYRVKRVA